MPRRILYDGQVTHPQRVMGTILAGCSLATTWMAIYLMRLLDRITNAAPGFTMLNTVDDIFLHSQAHSRSR
eukprot:1628456-Amphidinium_carterae.1